ncbi:MAG TPA: type II secretion system protein GspN [Verrucomicrobiae bacterium]|nr:type II secretion system protein GspN [Verrucomicrobiae bacterium]
MQLRRSLPYVGGVILFLCLTLLFAYLLVPLESVEGVCVRAAARAGLQLRLERLSRTFPPGLSARSAEIYDQRGTLLRVRELRVRPLLLPLLAGKLVLAGGGAIGGGEVSSTIIPGDGRLTLEIRSVPLQELPMLKVAAGADVKGTLKGGAEFTRKGNRLSGWVRGEVKQLEVAGASVGGVALPAATFETVRGLVRVGDAGGTIESLTFEGSGLYARLSGTLGRAAVPAAVPLDLVLELMPQAAFMESQKLVFLLLARYTASPGHYRIPVRGTISGPVVY